MKPKGAKVSVYFPAGIIAEIEAEAKRLDRSKAWLAQRAWLIARDTIRNWPTQRGP